MSVRVTRGREKWLLAPTLNKISISAHHHLWCDGKQPQCVGCLNGFSYCYIRALMTGIVLKAFWVSRTQLGRNVAVLISISFWRFANFGTGSFLKAVLFYFIFCWCYAIQYSIGRYLSITSKSCQCAIYQWFPTGIVLCKKHGGKMLNANKNAAKHIIMIS